MRLWHKDLIDVLPKNQLVSQWRELLAIKGSIDKTGYYTHL
ncbi:pyrimidine dimer DNA glycosylase/endonuclease V, partial [Clostridioides difficile]